MAILAKPTPDSISLLFIWPMKIIFNTSCNFKMNEQQVEGIDSFNIFEMHSFQGIGSFSSSYLSYYFSINGSFISI